MPKITFTPGVPEPVTLRYVSGKAVDSSFPPGSVQHMFSAEEGVFYLSDTAGGLLTARLKSMGVEAGETVLITKTQVKSLHTGRPTTEWIPRRPGAVGEQTDGTYAVPAPERSSNSVQ